MSDNTLRDKFLDAVFMELNAEIRRIADGREPSEDFKAKIDKMTADFKKEVFKPMDNFVAFVKEETNRFY